MAIEPVEGHVYPARFVALPEFLTAEEQQQVMEFVRKHERKFEISEVVSPGAKAMGVDPEHRRSRALYEIGPIHNLIADRLRFYLPRILKKLGCAEFPIADVEAQITASNDGDFFRVHNDNAQEPLETREITFVYFFHREPKAYRGGELVIYDSRYEGGEYIAQEERTTIVPQQNQLVVFPSSLLHEVRPVECASQKFLDSRFTVNGWLRR
jgi:Rps23 Pro-64 3,4-dihydroxylase Tpa1-like proline 4-hydroxylase